MIYRLPLRYIRLGIFISTPQLQSLRLSSDYICLTNFLPYCYLFIVSYLLLTILLLLLIVFNCCAGYLLKVETTQPPTICYWTRYHLR